MHLLFLDGYFEPERTSFTHLENDIIEYLIRKGHDITVVCPTPTRGIDKDVAKQYSKIKDEYLYNGKVHVKRFWAPQEKSSSLLRILRLYLSLWWA